MWSESCSVVSDSLQPHGLYSPWNSPGQNTGVRSLSLLQGIVPTQGSNPGLLHCRQFLYQLNHKRSPYISHQFSYTIVLITSLVKFNFFHNFLFSSLISHILYKVCPVCIIFSVSNYTYAFANIYTHTYIITYYVCRFPLYITYIRYELHIIQGWFDNMMSYLLMLLRLSLTLIFEN